MFWDQRRLRALLGEPGSLLLEDAELRVWQPDPDHAPQAYYLRRPLADADLPALAARLGLPLRPAPAAPDAIWQLPASLQWPDWQVQAGAGAQQAQGQLGALGVWLRGQGGQLQAVLLP